MGRKFQIRGWELEPVVRLSRSAHHLFKAWFLIWVSGATVLHQVLEGKGGEEEREQRFSLKVFRCCCCYLETSLWLGKSTAGVEGNGATLGERWDPISLPAGLCPFPPHTILPAITHSHTTQSYCFLPIPSPHSFAGPSSFPQIPGETMGIL